MNFTLKLSDEDTKLLKELAQKNNLSVSEFIRQIVIEKIEDELDLKEYNKALNEFKQDPKTYTLKEVESELK